MQNAEGRTQYKEFKNRMPLTAYRAHSYSQGFTLLETVVWVAAFAAAMIAIVSAITYFYRTDRFVVDQASATASAQRGIDKMVRVMREASYSANGAYPIISMATSSFSFYSDINNDGFAEQVRYTLQGDDIIEGIISPILGSASPYSGVESVSTLSEYVRNDASTPLFRYYDQSGTLMTTLTDTGSLRFVVVTLIADIDPVRSPTLLTLRSSAALRNLK